MVLRFLPVRGTLSQNMPQKRPTTSGGEPTNITNITENTSQTQIIHPNPPIAFDPGITASISASVGCERPHCVSTYCSFDSSSEITWFQNIWQMRKATLRRWDLRTCSYLKYTGKNCANVWALGYPQEIFGKWHVITSKTSSAAWDCTWRSSSPKSWNTTSQELTFLSKCFANNRPYYRFMIVID